MTLLRPGLLRNNRPRGNGVAALRLATLFDAPLTTSIVPMRAGGSGTPTFSRASTAYVRDHENVERLALAGEARFWGARRVRNYFTQSGDFSNVGSWVRNLIGNSLYSQPDRTGGTRAMKLVVDNGSSVLGNDGIGGTNQNMGVVWTVGDTTTVSVEAKAAESQVLRIRESVSTGRRAAFDLVTGVITYENAASATNFPAQMRELGDGWWLCSVTYVNTATSGNWSFKGCGAGTNTTGDGVSGLFIAFPQAELVNGQSVVTPSERVSTGVLSTPFHGSNVDGVKCFDTLRLHTQNACPRSEEQDNIAWAPVNWVATQSTVAPPAAVSTAKVFEWRDDAVNVAHRCAINPTGATYFSPGTTWEFSAYIKPGYMDEFNIRLADLAFTATGRYGITSISGMAGFTTVTGGGTCTGSIVDAGGGWRLVTVRFTFPQSVANNVGTLLMYPTFDVRLYAGTGAITTYVCAPSCRRVASEILSTYVPSGATSVGPTDTGATAPIPDTTLKKCLLEVTSTNLCPQPTAYSNVAWTKTDITTGPTDNSVTSPTGELNASTWTEGTGGTLALLSIVSNASAAGAVRTFSAYLKLGAAAPQQWCRIQMTDVTTPADGCAQWFNLSTGAVGTAGGLLGVGSSAFSSRILSIGNGWYKCEITCIPNALSTQVTCYILSATGDGSSTRQNNAVFNAWVSQIEAVAESTSPISTATMRFSDYLTYVNTGNVLDAGGTVYAEYCRQSTNVIGDFRGVCLTGNTVNRFQSIIEGSATGNFFRYGDGAAVVDCTPATTGLGSVLRKMAITWQNGTAASAKHKINTSTRGTAAAAPQVVSTGISIGGVVGNGLQPNAGVGNVRIYSQVLTDAQVDAMVA